MADDNGALVPVTDPADDRDDDTDAARERERREWRKEKYGVDDWQLDQLDTLATEIEDARLDVMKCQRNAVYRARDAGLGLLKVWEIVPWGKRSEWLRVNFHDSRETAYAYMRVADNWRTISRTLRRHDLTLREVLAMLRVKKVPPEQPDRPPDAETPDAETPGPETDTAPAAALPRRRPDAPPDEKRPDTVEAAVGGLCTEFRASIDRVMEPSEAVYWGLFRHGEGIEEFVRGMNAELRPVASVVMPAYRRWHERADAEPDSRGADLEDDFKLEVWRALKHRRSELTYRQRRSVYELVKTAREFAYCGEEPDSDTVGYDPKEARRAGNKRFVLNGWADRREDEWDA